MARGEAHHEVIGKGRECFGIVGDTKPATLPTTTKHQESPVFVFARERTENKLLASPTEVLLVSKNNFVPSSIQMRRFASVMKRFTNVGAEARRVS